METKTERSEIETRVKTIGLQVPLPLHREFLLVARKQKLNASALLRKLLIQHLDEQMGE